MITCYALTAEQADSLPYWVPALVHCRSLYWTIYCRQMRRSRFLLKQLSESRFTLFWLAHTLCTVHRSAPKILKTEWPNKNKCKSSLNPSFPVYREEEVRVEPSMSRLAGRCDNHYATGDRHVKLGYSNSMNKNKNNNI